MRYDNKGDNIMVAILMMIIVAKLSMVVVKQMPDYSELVIP